MMPSCQLGSSAFLCSGRDHEYSLSLNSGELSLSTGEISGTTVQSGVNHRTGDMTSSMKRLLSLIDSALAVVNDDSQQTCEEKQDEAIFQTGVSPPDSMVKGGVNTSTAAPESSSLNTSVPPQGGNGG